MRAANALADIYADAIARGARGRRPRRRGRRRRGRPRPDAAPSPGRRLRRCSSTTRRASRNGRHDASSPISAAATSRPAGGARRWCRPSTRRSSAASVHRVVVNMGGIANVTDLARQQATSAASTPAPATFSSTCGTRAIAISLRSRRRVGAIGARRSRSLLAALLAEPYFARVPPKSTGRDLFDSDWLAIAARGRAIGPADVQATLVALTARTIADRRADALRGRASKC